MDMKSRAATYTAITVGNIAGLIALVIVSPDSAFYVMCVILFIMVTYMIYTSFLMRERRKEIDREYEEAKKKRDEHWEKLMGRPGRGGPK